MSLALPVANSWSQPVEGRELMEWCAGGSSAGTAACTAYIMGMADAITDARFASCTKGVARNQIRGAVIKELLALPPQVLLDLPAGLPLTQALQRAFPCQR